MLHSTGIPPQKIVYLPCPMDLEELPYKQRMRADSILFSNGWGGVHFRKGWPQVREVAQRNPGLVTVRSQRKLDGVPPGTQVLGTVDNPCDLYNGYDLACQPSRFEGMGLALLESLACGIPVVTTDAEPMNQYIKDAFGERAKDFLAKVDRVETVRIWDHDWESNIVSVADLEQKLLNLKGTDISEVSKLAREYVEAVHGEATWQKLWEVICG